LTLRVRARSERVELAVELLRRAAEQARGLVSGRRRQLCAGALELLGRVEQRAVVDAHGIHRLVLDDGRCTGY
jgi:hypothetical protein